MVHNRHDCVLAGEFLRAQNWNKGFDDLPIMVVGARYIFGRDFGGNSND
jgi:hypothetical protein